MSGIKSVSASLTRIISALLLAVTGLGGGALAADPQPALQLGAPFTDHAVLQRDAEVPIWGWTQPGRRVTVAFAGQEKAATAGKDGKWMVKLDPVPASFEPAEMVIGDAADGAITVKDVLVGEVWMASGQSNMQWKVEKSDCSGLEVAPRNGVAPIREFEVTSVFAMLHPIERATGSWKNGEYGNYSAIAFAFAHRLYEELGVPIGILNCSFSQTAIQAWVPREGFRDGKDEYTRGIYQKILQTAPSTPEHREAWDAFYQRVAAAADEGKPVPEKLPGNMNGNRDASWLFNGRLSPVVPYAIRGAIWNQGYANMGEGLPYYHNLHSLIRGWRMVWNRPQLPVYFHQFYSPGNGPKSPRPTINSTAEMRLGTWMARDIPHAGMASQIDIEGAIHYRNKAVPGRRLALHALKNQYGREVIADGPMYKTYRVDGNKLIVSFEHAGGGLLVAKTGPDSGPEGLGTPQIIENGDDQVKLFYLADADRVWYPATVRIDGSEAIVTSPKVSRPHGVAYGTGGIGFQPNLYNRGLLPTTPFIVYDHKMVTRETWPDEKLKIDGVTIDPATVGKAYEYRKMPLLSTQFRDNAVLQAGVPVTIWGSAIHPWGYEADGEAVIRFRFAGTEKTIPVTPGMKEWQVTLPPMASSAEPKTLRVTFSIDGELVHERIAENVVIGDVWYVAAYDGIGTLSKQKPSGQIVRAIQRKAKRSSSPLPSRYSVAVSTTPKNRFASEWAEADGLAAAIGHRIAAHAGNPVGIIFMDTVANKNKEHPGLKSWIPAEYLNLAPSLTADFEQLASLRPGTPQYAANTGRYIDAWKQYWSDYIPEMIATRAVPDGKSWGTYPRFGGGVDTKASQTYNVLTDSFTPAALKGILFLSGPATVAEDGGALFGEQMTALAAAWQRRFGGDPCFVYTIPTPELAEKITRPTTIAGRSAAAAIRAWPEGGRGRNPKPLEGAAAEDLAKAIDLAITTAYAK